MRPILSSAAYEGLLRELSSEQVLQAATAIADAARELMRQEGLSRAVILCSQPMREIGSKAGELLDGSKAVFAANELLDLSDAVICDLLFEATPDGSKEPWIRAMHDSKGPILSVGIPAGVDPDTGHAGIDAVTAQVTVSPFAYVPGLFLHDGLDHSGRICPIGPAAKTDDEPFRMEASDAQRFLPPRKRTAHKGDSGKALLCVGSPKFIGAGLLSARACLAAGCGILYVACPDTVRAALSRLPEAIGIPVGADWDAESCQRAIGSMEGMKAVGLGCGVGDGDVSALIEAALKAKLPMVLDADGLNCLSRHKDLYPLLHERVILTPHPGEMSRLTGWPIGRILEDPIAVAKRCAEKWHCVVLLKGAATVVSDGKRTCLVAEGNAGLGKGGSGDALTGIITGLLSQGIEPFAAACLGSFLLGTSAENAFELLRERMLRATHVIEALEDRKE